MNAQQLKNSILQEAIEGRLVPQDPNDEPASVLLDRIRKEKAKLVKEKQVYKKSETIPFFDEVSYPFKIPDNWEWVQLSDVSIIQEGAGIRKFQYTKDGVQLLCVTNILDGYVDLSKKALFVSEKEYKEKYQHLTPQKGDIVTACSGGSWGKIAIYNLDDVVMLNTSTLRLRFFSDLANNMYLYYLAQSNFFKDQLANQLVGIQPNFGYAHYSRICFPLPPLAEQKRIVAKIEELLPKVEEYGKAQESLDKLNEELPEKLKKSILQEAIEGRLVPQDPNDEPASDLLDKIRAEKKRLVKEGKLKKKVLEETPISEDEKPFEIPESWEWSRLGTHISATSGLAYKKDDLGIISNEYVRVLRGGNISFGSWSIKADDVMIGKQFVDDELLLKKGMFISPAVTSLEHMGKTALIREDQNNVVAGGFVLMFHPYYYNEKYWEFLNIFFQSGYYREKCKSITNKSGQAFYNLSRAKLLEVLIPLPPLSEQHRIVAKIEQLMKEIDKLKV